MSNRYRYAQRLKDSYKKIGKRCPDSARIYRRMNKLSAALAKNSR